MMFIYITRDEIEENRSSKVCLWSSKPVKEQGKYVIKRSCPGSFLKTSPFAIIKVDSFAQRFGFEPQYGYLKKCLLTPDIPFTSSRED